MAVKKVKAPLGFRGKGREVKVGADGYQFKEGSATYSALFGAKKCDIGQQNAYFWDVTAE